MQEDEALQLARDMVAQGASSLQILGLCREAMGEVGRRFESGKYFLPELMLAGELLREISGIVKSSVGDAKPAETLGDVVLGTVQGDIHDIGKDIVGFMLEVNGFRVHDLGVDVPPARFVEALQQTGASVLALSGLLTLAFDAMRDTVSAVEAAGLRNRVKVMIGGGAMDQQVADFAHADAFGVDAMAAVALARLWIIGE
jgi:5-methyltetrahydrofolate--homocysteine methyltransferase